MTIDCLPHQVLMKAIVGLLTLDDHAGTGATQREACRTVQLLATRADNVYRLLGAGLIVSLSMLARTENLIKKQFASTMLLRVASEASCRSSLLDAGGARTLCFLCRPSLPRKVVRPAANAISLMCNSAECVPSLLDTGAGSVLATLASSSDPEMLLNGCQALANMLACMAEEAETVAKAVRRTGSPVVSRPASPFSSTSAISPISAEEDEEHDASTQGQGPAPQPSPHHSLSEERRPGRHSRHGSRDSLAVERRPGRSAPEPEGAPSRAPPPEAEGALTSAVSSADPLGRVREAFRVTDQLHADGLPHCMLMASLIAC